MADRYRLPELSESEMTSLLDQKSSDNTKKATKVALNVFRDYLKERKIDEDSLVASKDKLATVLRTFDAEARKKNGLKLPSKNWLKQTRWSNDKTIIELSYRKMSWFVSVSQINYLPPPLASANNWSARHWQITIFCSTSSNNSRSAQAHWCKLVYIVIFAQPISCVSALSYSIWNVISWHNLEFVIAIIRLWHQSLICVTFY